MAKLPSPTVRPVKLLPVKIPNLPDICQMTDCYLQPSETHKDKTSFSQYVHQMDRPKYQHCGGVRVIVVGIVGILVSSGP